jgi:hypothetical protein
MVSPELRRCLANGLFYLRIGIKFQIIRESNNNPQDDAEAWSRLGQGISE